MKTGFTTMGTPSMSLGEIFSLAKEYSFDSVDLRMHKDGEVPLDLSDDKAEEIVKAAGKTELFSLLCYNLTLGNDTEDIIKSILQCIKAGETLGLKAVRIFSGRIETEEQLNEFSSILKKIFESYRGSINLLVQNHKNLGVSCEQAIEIGKRVNDNRFGFIFSPDQATKNGENYMNLLKELVPVTKQIYIADVNSEGLYCLIGEGIVPLKDILLKMKEYGFDEYVTLKWEKCWCDYLPSFNEGAESFFEILNGGIIK